MKMRTTIGQPPEAANSSDRLADCRLRDIFLLAFRREWEA